MFDKTKKAADRAVATEKARDVMDRAARASNAGLAQSTDRLGTPRVGRDVL